MESISLRYEDAQIGDTIYFRELKIWGEISRIYHGYNRKFDFLADHGETFEQIEPRHFDIYRELEVGTEIECFECYGDGEYEYGPVCYKSAANCCGGCYEVRKCEKCDGIGKIIIT